MPVNPQDVEGLEDETVTLWSHAEDALIGALSAAALAVSVRARSPEHARQVAAEELARTIRPQSVAVARVLQQSTSALVEAAVSEAAGIGAAAAHTEVAALPAGTTAAPAAPTVAQAAASTAAAPKPAMVLPETRPQIPGSAAARGAASKATEATTTSLGKAARSIPRNTQTVWGKIIDNAVNKTVTGDLTIQQALQQAMDDAAKQGLGFYRDSAGRKWGLDTYSEMAIRTGTNNALIDAHTAELVEVGLDLVIVSSHENPAPQCTPYERKVLSLTGEHQAGTHRIDGHTITVTDTLNGARAQGFEHPNCRHTVTAYLPGFTDTTPPAADTDHEGYKATQKQRYYEREIRKSRRMEQAAIDEDGRKKAYARRRQYEKKLREHIREHDLPRRRHREKLRQPGNPMPVA